MATTINQPMQDPGETQENALTNLLSRSVTINWYVVIFAVILLLAIFTRFFALGERVISHDESLHTQYSYGLYTDGQFEHTPLMHGPILFHFTALSYFLFGDNDFTSRIYTAVLGVLVVMSPLLFRRWLGRWGTIIASVLLLASPLMTYYSRYIRHDMPSILSAILMIWAAMMYLGGPANQKRRAHWLYIIAGAMVWNLGSKETAFIYIAIFGFFLTVYWLVRVVQHFYNIPGKPVFQTLMIGMLLAVVFTLLMILVISIGLGNTSVVGGETLSARLNFIGDQFSVLLSGDPVTTDFATFLSWVGLSFVFLFVTIIGTALWVYKRDGTNTVSPVDILLVAVLVLLTGVLSGIASLTVGVIISASIGLVYAAFRLRPVLPFTRQFLAVFAVMMIFGSGLLLFEELSHEPSRAGGEEVIAQPVPGEETEAVAIETEFTLLPIVLAWVVAAVLVGGLLYSRRAGWWDVLDNFPELDVLIVMGSLILPWLTAFIIYATNPDSTAYADIASGLPEIFRNIIPTGVVDPTQELARVGRVLIGILAWIPMMTVAVVAGVVWNWRRWLISAAIFHIIFAFFFTTIFTNIEGLATGMIYSLEYWLEQQGVRRGSQPQYYYLLVILPLYEYLPIIGSVLAMFGGMVVFWRQRRERQEALVAETEMPVVETLVDDEDNLEITNTPDEDDALEEPKSTRSPIDSRWRLDTVPFTLMVGWWAVANLFAYTLSGEKMPWLGTHMTVPMIFLTAWYFGRIIDRIDLHTLLEKRGWIYLFVLPLGMVVLFQIIAPFLGGQAPFQGTTRLEQTWTYQWLGVVFLGGMVAYGVIWLVRFTGWSHLRQLIAVTVLVLLSVITFRAAWMASFINYDLATEFLVYAHGAPGNQIVYDTLQDLSLRTTGGMDIRFGYDDGMSWPGSWYFRDFNNALFYHSNPTLRQLEDVVAVTVRDDGRAEVEPYWATISSGLTTCGCGGPCRTTST